MADTGADASLAGSPRSPGAAGPAVSGAPLVEALGREFEELGLSPYEARVLLALLQVGAANTAQIARLSGVPRTSSYQVLEALQVKHLAQRVPGEGPATWTSVGRDEVLDRLDAAEEERLRQHRARSGRVRDVLAEALSDQPPAVLQHVQLIHGVAQVARSFDRLWADVEHEVVAFSRPPYVSAAGEVAPAVIDALARGVRVRSLYQSAQVGDPDSAEFRAEIAAYVDAGVEARVVEQLPIKLLVFDRQSSLMALIDNDHGSYPTNLLIDHSGFSALQADAFEVRWSAATPFGEAAR